MAATIFRLTNEKAPLSFTLQSRHKKGRGLTYKDPKTGKSRPLRYATNHDTPFADEQEGEVMLGEIEFKDGMLRVDENDNILLNFLKHHPDLNLRFEKVDKKKEAVEELKDYDIEYEAYSKAKSLDIHNVEKLIRVILGYEPSNMTSMEMKRDLVVFARNNPEDFLSFLDDPNIDSQSDIEELREMNIISLRNKEKEVFYNLPDNKSKIVTVKQGEEDWRESLKNYFDTDAGMQVYKMLMSILRTKK